MSISVIDLQYRYSSSDEADLDSALSALESELGGQRRPWAFRASAIDLVAFLEIVVTFIAGATLGEALKNYLGGLTGVDQAKKLGERHQEVILKWLDAVKDSIHRLVSSVRLRFHEELNALYFEEMEQAIAMVICLGQLQCYVVLNGRNVTDTALENLPGAVTKMLQFIAEVGLPEESDILQLCLDPRSDQWRYLLVPSHQAFGRFVDRIIDLSTGELLFLRSREEFITLLGATRDEGIKFLINPYKYVE